LRKGQLAIEFIFLIGAAFMIFLVYTAASREDVMQAESAKEFALVKDLAFSLQSEINRVGSYEDGYRRDFRIPSTLEGFKYNLTIIQNILLINTSEYDYSVSVLPVQGNFTKGSNSIRKVSGAILINT
jgi:hypothetical protein